MPLDKEIYRKLEKIVGEQFISDADIDRVCHSYDATKQRSLPDVVMRPGSAQEISEIMKIANEYQIGRAHV